MRILIVDDDATGRYLFESIMRAEGYEVANAADGEEALAVARSESPDLIVSDILMPRMDGYQLCRAWKADPALAGIPFVFYTASYTDRADERFALGLGADAFWRKPMEPVALARAVASLPLKAATGPRAPELTEETDVLKQYNASLVRKIEEKARTLEKANAELRRERDFTRQVLELADLFVCVLDDDMRVLLLSAGAERLIGHDAETAAADGLEVFVAPAERLPLEASLRGLPEGGVKRCDLAVLAADGRELTLECTLARTPGAEGERGGFNIFGVDVTERRCLEQTKTEFIQVVSHELRTPLTSIVGFVDLLGNLPRETLVEQAPTIAAHLWQNTERMRALVEELLEVNAIAVEGITLQLRSVDLGAIVRRSAGAVFRDPVHEVSVSVDPALPPVRCDAERIGRVVTNLVSNAVKYSPDGGSIEVVAGVEDGFAVVSVTDHGIGIPEADIPTLFCRFSQRDMSSTRPFSGIGLGLFIVAEIVAAHGGSVDVTSAEGDGSTFVVRLPVAGP